MGSIKVGNVAPPFKLLDKDGREHSLNTIASKFTVVYFYPKDNTPGCTIEAQEFSAGLASLKKLGASVIGISGGDAKSKGKFCDAYDLTVTLVSDPDFKIAAKYDSYGEKVFMGRKYKGILRNTFLLDGNKKILHIFRNVTPKGHVQELKDALGNLAKGKAIASSAPQTKGKGVGAKKAPLKGTSSTKRAPRKGPQRKK